MKNTILTFVAISLLAFVGCTPSDDFDFGSPSSSSSGSGIGISAGTTLHAVSVDQFSWIEGQSSWAAVSKDRLYSSTFSFGSAGSFTYSFLWEGYGTYKLHGQYSVSGNKITFVADRSTSNGSGSGTQTLVQGSITKKSGGQYRVEMEYAASANYYAKVNSSEFWNDVFKQFTTVMTAD